MIVRVSFQSLRIFVWLLKILSICVKGQREATIMVNNKNVIILLNTFVNNRNTKNLKNIIYKYLKMVLLHYFKSTIIIRLFCINCLTVYFDFSI